MVDDPASISGSHLLLKSENAWARSAPFVVPTQAQGLRFDYLSWKAHNANWPLYVVWLALNQGWQQGVVDLQAFQRQTIQLIRTRDQVGNQSDFTCDLLGRLETITGYTEPGGAGTAPGVAPTMSLMPGATAMTSAAPELPAITASAPTHP
ncbi:MAG: hypothetical protein KatS3mg057_2347 [Herpetosiphonaceae bacterium]|nr:MAG: hypothetical protein KatS3mg057_2347 [Herpetosiphonaceae bacterium]